MFTLGTAETNQVFLGLRIDESCRGSGLFPAAFLALLLIKG